jgi:hypothetical protein
MAFSLRRKTMTEDDGFVTVTPVDYTSDAHLDFGVGDKVRKVKGYPWTGVVVSAFTTLTGQSRYVVECTVPEVLGALHIYNGEQLEHRED